MSKYIWQLTNPLQADEVDTFTCLFKKYHEVDEYIIKEIPGPPRCNKRYAIFTTGKHIDRKYKLG